MRSPMTAEKPTAIFVRVFELAGSVKRVPVVAEQPGARAKAPRTRSVQ
jgi:hypothetical protein